MVAYGGFWRRFVAYFIDAITVNIALSMITTVLGVGGGFGGFAGQSFDEAAVIGLLSANIAISFIGTWLYFAVMESSHLQATVGKLALGVIVTDLEGQRISFLRATGRYFAKVLSGMILLIGYIMIGFTERKQGLHDMVASTLVHKTRDPGSVRSSAAVFE